MVCFLSSRNVREGDLGSLPGARRLTLLILLPERKYGRWPNTEAYHWWSQWEGSVSKPLYKPLRKYTHKSTSAGMPGFLTPDTAPGPDFPFHQLFSSFSNQNRLKDWDLICCHSYPAWFGWQAGSWAAVELMRSRAGRKFRSFGRIPTEQKGNH